jgi:hypothetical protein
VTKPAFTIREATATDLPALQELLSERDGVAHGLSSVTRLFAGLDPEQCRAWLAEVDGRPAGVTAMLIREVLDDRQRHRKIAYWTNLFVRGEYGRLMVYPVLVHSMLKAVKQAELGWCCTVMRRPKVLEGHLKLGFAKLGEIAVLARPLRPLRLISRRFPSLRWAGPIGAPIDAAAGLLGRGVARTLGAGLEIQEQEWSGVANGTFEWIAAVQSGAARELCTAWTPATLRARGSLTLDAAPMLLLVARREGSIAGALSYRMGRREGIVAAVGMDLWAAEPAVARALIHALAERGVRRGADVALWLDGDVRLRRAFRSAGFLPTPERYTLIAWPKQALAEAQLPGDVARWRFTFLDHDAF